MRINKQRRYLRPKKLGKKSKDFYVFDTETGILKDGKINWILSARPEHMIFGCVYGPNGYKKIIHTVKDFKKEFKRKHYRNKIVYAHNAEYDLSAIYGNIYHMDPEAVFNGKFICATNGVCTFADSFNIMPASVKVIGDLIGLPKLQLGEALVSNVADLYKDVDYCMRDCEIVYKGLEQMFLETEPSFTIGSISLKDFLCNYLKFSVRVNHLSDRFFDATYGGRTEAFYIGDCEGYVNDINSAYPFAMSGNKYPDPGKLRSVRNPSLLQSTDILYSGSEGMITCDVEVDKNINIPVLPHRTPDSLLFPCGTFTGSWVFPEIKYALDNGFVKINKVHEIIYAPAIESPFKEFILDNYAEREKTTNTFRKYYLKLKMNNLYGKLLQRAKEEYRYCKTAKEASEYMRARHIRKGELLEVVDGYFLRFENHKLFNHTIACWGSYVTAYVRIMLHKFMMEHSNSVLYCDTDSVFSSKKIALDEKHLGGWKLEDKIITKIRALKDYTYLDFQGNKGQMLKGVKKSAVQLDENANVFKMQRMIKTRESMRRVDNLPPGTFIDQHKFLTGEYKKRTVLKNGTTKPLIV